MGIDIYLIQMETGCNPPFSGKVKSFDSTNNLVTFTECTGKLYHEYNNYRTFEKGDVILKHHQVEQVLVQDFINLHKPQTLY